MKAIGILTSALKAQRRYFTDSKQEIARENLIIMQIACTIGAVITFIFFIIAPIIIPTWTITLEYKLIVPILVLAALFSFIYYRRRSAPNPLIVELTCALLYSLLLAAFIALSVFPYPDTPQIFISLFFMFMPALLILRPAVLLAIMVAAEAVFLLLAIRYKTPFSIENDIFNTVAAIFFSLIIMTITNLLRTRNYNARLELEKLSQTDALTGLLNKNSFEERCSAYLNLPPSPCTLIILDLDNFKLINDSNGHPFGDSLLEKTGSILRSVFRQSDLVGRIGGDEFGVLLRGLTEHSLLTKKCAELSARFSSLKIGSLELRFSCSIGAATLRSGSRGYSELFQLADEALYQAKREKKGTAVIRNCDPR